MTPVPRTYCCSVPYCPNLVEGRPGRCAEHQTSWGAFKAKAPPGAYGAQWRKVRDAYLASHKTCEVCGLKPAVQVHHRNHNPLDNAWSNLLAVDDDCHRTLTGRRSAELARARATRSRSQPLR